MLSQQDINSVQEKDFLFHFLHLSGLIRQSNIYTPNRITVIIFSAYMTVTYLDGLVLCLIQITCPAHQWKVTLGYILSFTLSLALWLIIRWKTKCLTALLHDLQEISLPHKKASMNITFCVICCLPVMYSIIIVISSLNNDLAIYNTLYTYGKLIQNSTIRSTVIGLKCFLMTFLYPTFISIIALLFGRLCHQCCSLTKHLTLQIKKYPVKDFTRAKQVEILKFKTRINKILNKMQELFSLPSLLTCIASFSASWSIVGSFVMLEWKQFTTVSKGFDTVYTMCHSTVALFSVICTAGQVPIEMANFRDAFCEKIYCRELRNLDPEDSKLERCLYDKPDFVMSGGNIIYFRRGLVLAMVGTILTYAFLLMNTKPS